MGNKNSLSLLGVEQDWLNCILLLDYTFILRHLNKILTTQGSYNYKSAKGK